MLTTIVLLTLSSSPVAASLAASEAEPVPRPPQKPAALERPRPFALLPVLTALLADAAPAPGAAQDADADADADADDLWTGSLTAGVNHSSGNSDVTTAHVAVDVEREDETGRVRGKTNYNYAEQEGDVTQRRFGLHAQYDYFLTERTYALVTATYETDSEANLDRRLTGGVGYGADVVKKERTELSVEAGLNYVQEEFEGPEDGDEYVAVRLASNLRHELNEEVTFENSTQILQGLEESDDIYAKTDAKLRANLSEKMFMQLQVVLDYDNTPAAGAERLDTQIIAGVGWGF